MKYLKQFGIILTISFISEMLHAWIPLPIPASIYGIVLLFTCLQTKCIRVASIKETSTFLIEIMPLMFIPAAVGLIEVLDILRSALFAYMTIMVVSTFTVMGVSGRCTQALIRRQAERNAIDE